MLIICYLNFFPTSEKLLSAKQSKISTELSGIMQLLKTLYAKWYVSLSHFLKIEGQGKKIITIIRLF